MIFVVSRTFCRGTIVSTVTASCYILYHLLRGTVSHITYSMFTIFFFVIISCNLALFCLRNAYVFLEKF